MAFVQIINRNCKNNLTNVIMHDWYIGLLSCYGQIDFIDKPMILYRQHDNNQVGAKEFTLNALLSVENVISILRKANSVRKPKSRLNYSYLIIAP